MVRIPPSRMGKTEEMDGKYFVLMMGGGGGGWGGAADRLG
jgi:hypothetical protein